MNIILKVFTGLVLILSVLCLGAATSESSPPVSDIPAADAGGSVKNSNAGADQLQAAAAGTCPCDIYASGGTPCVAAHSTVRALYSSYNGNLYQVRRASDGATRDIPVLSPGGYADSAVQDSFCAGTTCTISIIYDQSPNGNHLPKSPTALWLPNGGKEAPAAAAKINAGGHPVYGVYVNADSVAYRNNNTKGIPTGDQPESMYMVVDGKRYSDACCFDYGNAETNGRDNGNGTMEAVYWGTDITWGGKGEGNGPWIAADLENGVFKGDKGGWQSQSVYTPSAKSVIASFATAMLKGYSGNHFGLKAADAQSGTLTTMWDGARPSPGYSPKKLEGAIILGTGGDGSNGGKGTFFEGCMTSGVPSDAIDNQIQANIVAAGYGSASTPGPTATPAPTSTPNQNPIWSGGPYALTGSSSSYTDLPDGITGDLNDFSIACWVKLNTLDTWSRIFDFGGDTNVFMMLTAKSGSTGYPYFCITTSGNSGEQGIDGTSALPTGSWQHLAVVKSGNTGILYINKQEVGRNTGITLRPADLGNTLNNYIGKSQWSNDPYLNASVDKFVVYNRALSAAEVSTLGGNPPGGLLGDANGSGTIDIVDALMTAQQSVGLNPAGFIAANADVNCDGSITIVDALMIAQYFVGLISSFC